jgi:hypothetical protein
LLLRSIQNADLMCFQGANKKTPGLRLYHCDNRGDCQVATGGINELDCSKNRFYTAHLTIEKTK